MCAALASCSSDQPVPTAPAVPDHAPAKVAAACPDADFDAFLARFSRDIAVQKSASADPLTQSHVDAGADPEPRVVTVDVSLAAVNWPVIPDLDAARRGGREVVMTDEPGGVRKVVVRVPDSDNQQTYHFVTRPCWTLVSMSDDTL